MRGKLFSIGKRSMAIALAGVLTVSGIGISPAVTAEAAGAQSDRVVSDVKGMYQFDMTDVVVTDEYYDNSLQKEIAYLESLDENRLLAGFKETAAYAKGMTEAERTAFLDGATRYGTEKNTGNWENSLIGGHTLGHYLSAISQAVVNPGTKEEDKQKLQEKLDNIIDTLKVCQEYSRDSSACKEGYIFGATLLGNTSNLEFQFDNNEKGWINISTQSWVPWYTMHKILAGLVEAYELTGDEDALAVAEGVGEWTYNRASSWNAATRKVVLGIEYGGMNDALYELAKCTKDAAKQEHFIAAAKIFDEDIAVGSASKSLFQMVKDGDKNCLSGKHANTTVPKFLGSLNRYVVLSGLGKLTENDKVYLEYAKSFWEMVVNKHSYITGGNSEWEHFGEDEILNGERTNCNNETCNTYNMLKLSRGLFMITGEKKYADFYERVLINAIEASQNPESGMSMYFQPMATGYFKVYSTETEDFWCCTGSGMENFTKLNDSIYYYKDNNVVVNQYRSSELTYEEKNLKLVQEADMLTGTTQKFTVQTVSGEEDVDVNLLFRIPDYAASDITIKVAGTEYEYAVVDGYAVVTGPFVKGTEITVDIPMEVTYEKLPDSENTYGFKYGPFVLCAQLGSEHTTRGTDTMETGVTVDIPKASIVSTENILISGKVETVENYLNNINTYFEKSVTDGKLSFKMKETDQELTFVPYYSEHTNRYGIYWNLLTDEEGIESAKVIEEKTKTYENKKLDTTQPGYGQYENDDLHKMEESKSVGQTSDGTSRLAQAGGYFSYRMVVSDDKNTSLICSFRKSDNGKTIKISVGNTVIANETLNYDGDEAVYSKMFTIGKDVAAANKEIYTKDEESVNVVRVKFESGKADEDSAEVYGYIYTYDELGTEAELTSVTADRGTVTNEGKAYKVIAPATANSVELTFAAKDADGYVTVNGKAVSESKKVDLSNSRKVSLDVRVYASDLVTYSDYTVTVYKDYEKEESLIYFVDCGDYNVTTVSEGDKLGTHNSVTDQAYGEDPVTGYSWGIQDTISNPLKNGSSTATEDAAYTDNTWPFETDSTVTDGVAKTRTNRYTKNQFENGIAERFLDYEFEIENGTYDIEVGFSNPWNCSTNPNLYVNKGTEKEQTLAAKIGVPGNGTKTVTGTITVTDGKFTLNARSDANDSTTLAINMTYIKIMTQKKTDDTGNTQTPGNTDQKPNTNTNTNTNTNGNTSTGNGNVTTTTSLKKATITVKKGKKKVSKVTVKKGKKVTLKVTTSSKAKLSLTKLTKKQKKLVKVTFKKGKLTIQGKKKGIVKLKLSSAKTKKYKKATKTIKVTVKK